MGTSMSTRLYAGVQTFTLVPMLLEILMSMSTNPQGRYRYIAGMQTCMGTDSTNLI